MALEIVRRGSAGWEAAAALAHDTYRDVYGARPQPAPETFGVITADGGPAAVAGLTFAGSSPLFSEYYLERPVEQLIAERCGLTVARSEILEVGPLASVQPRAGLQMLAHLRLLSWCNGARAVLCTIPPGLVTQLVRMGLAPVVLGHASEDLLPPYLRGYWGTYYAQGPVTLCLPIPDIGEEIATLSAQLSVRAGERQAA